MTTTTISPTIVCPPWCTVDKARHIADLSNLEGGCGHESDAMTHPAGIHRDESGHPVWLSSFTEFGGSPASDGGTFVEVEGSSYAPDDAERLALHILELVKAARA